MEKVYVLGGEQTDFERNWSKEGKNVIALLRECLDSGCKDAGLSFDEIKSLNKENRIACFVGNFIGEYYINQGHLGALLTEADEAFYGVPSARYEAACASGSVAIEAAMSSIQAGIYDTAIVIGWELMKTVNTLQCADYLGRAALYEKEAMGIDMPFPKLFGRLADEMLIRYKLDEKKLLDSLSYISNKNYDNGKRNSKAQTRKWFMDSEEAKARGSKSNRIVGGRLAISDCSQVTDGAAVVVLASERYIKEKYHKVNKDIPFIKGFGHRIAPMTLEEKFKESMDNPYILPWTRQAILDAYKRANLTVKDIDFFETHDCFTSSEYMAISAFGLTMPGEEYKAAEDNIIGFNGEKPINPSGGLIGCGHPVGATGVRMFLDLYKQLTGKAEKYQLENVKNGMMLNLGGTATTNFSFILGLDDNER